MAAKVGIVITKKGTHKEVAAFTVEIDLSSDAFLAQLAKTRRHHRGSNLLKVAANEFALSQIKPRRNCDIGATFISSDYPI